MPKRNDESSHVFACNGLDHIIWRSTQKLRDDGELVDVILAREQWLALQHLRKDASCAPDINFDVVFLPGEHNLGCSVVSSRDVTGHLRILYTGQSEIADLQVAIFVHQDVAGLQVSVDHAGGMDIFEASLRFPLALPGCANVRLTIYQDLVQEVLYELLFERSGGKQAVQVGAEQFGDKVTAVHSDQHIVKRPAHQGRSAHVLEG